MAKMTVDTPKKTAKRKVERFRVHRASNGWTVHHEMEPPKSKPGHSLMMSMDPDPKPAVFTDKAALMDHLSSLADQMGPEESGAPEPGGAEEGQ